MKKRHPFNYESLLKLCFNYSEALTSAFIEGNNTKAIDAVGETTENVDDSINEVLDIYDTLSVIELFIDEKITKSTIFDVHKLLTKNQSDYVNGKYKHNKYRTNNVKVSNHTPMFHMKIDEHMEKLIRSCNRAKTITDVADIHHKFVWIHPFADGNGRTVRILTYILLQKLNYEAWVINPSGAFSDDRDAYINNLQLADKGDLTSWRKYVKTIFQENYMNNGKLKDGKYFFKPIFSDALDMMVKYKKINKVEKEILAIAFNETVISRKDIVGKINKTPHYTSRVLTKLTKGNFLAKVDTYKYTIDINSSCIISNVLYSLKKNGHIKAIK